MYRSFKVTDESKSMTLDHYHFKGWPDWETPVGKSRKSFESLVDFAAKYVMENASKQGDERKKLAVHCRAGIGRTGTTISLINATITIQE